MKLHYFKSTPILLLVLSLLLASCSEKQNVDENRPGLLGIYCSEPDFTSIKGISNLISLNQLWDETVDYEGDTSGEWEGYLIAPITGEIEFYVETNKSLDVSIMENNISVEKGELKKILLNTKKGESYAIKIRFLNPGKYSEPGSFHIKWAWSGKDASEIPVSNFYHTIKEAEKLAFLENLNKNEFDENQYLYAKGKNVTVYYEPGRFAAWPANGALWSWGDELLLSFTRAYFKDNKYHHSIDREKPIGNAMSRSLDGGETWVVEDSLWFSRNRGDVIELKEKINFSHSDFALRNNGRDFYYTYNRGKEWSGPFNYPDFGFDQLTSRTDYLITNKNEILVFGSAKDKTVQGPLQDKAITLKSTNGGVNFEFLSFMTEKDSIRSVMPATVRFSDTHLVSALRRRIDPPKEEKYGLPKNWIDVYESFDNGVSWKFLHKIANTDTGIRNGNPPSMVKLENDVLCVIYGYRGNPSGIRAKISYDKGKTWSKEIILRNDASTWDIGYSRSIVRPDGKIVSIYYYATEELPERHIAATIWNPLLIEKQNE